MGITYQKLIDYDTPCSSTYDYPADTKYSVEAFGAGMAQAGSNMGQSGSSSGSGSFGAGDKTGKTNGDKKQKKNKKGQRNSFGTAAFRVADSPSTSTSTPFTPSVPFRPTPFTNPFTTYQPYQNLPYQPYQSFQPSSITNAFPAQYQGYPMATFGSRSYSAFPSYGFQRAFPGSFGFTPSRSYSYLG
jgi:PPE-repeat protein